MITPEQAVDTILQHTPILEEETIDFLDCAGRVLARDVMSPEDQPPFDRSAMDGYAVRAQDLAQASNDSPAELKVVGLARAGRPAGVEIGPGEAVRIMTGGMVPASADTVVMQEVTDLGGETVRIFEPCPPKQNICYRGEDIRRGERLLPAGCLLPPAACGMFAAVGLREVPVVRRPRVAILSTGDELVDVGDIPKPGQIRNSNQYSLHALIRQAGAEPSLIGVVGDEEGALAGKIRDGLTYDVLISTGGVSVGEYDLVAGVFAELGVQLAFSKIAVKPGKPVVFGHKDGRLVFGLPGNPTSTVVAFLLFARPALLKMGGRRRVFLERREAVLGETIKTRPGRRTYMRAFLDEENGAARVRLTGHQGSGNLLGAVLANCFLEIPADTAKLEEGATVGVLMLP